MFDKLQLPHLKGVVTDRMEADGPEFKGLEDIPSYLWFNRIWHAVPLNVKYRKKLCLEIFGWRHQDFCENTSFHTVYLHKNSGYDPIGAYDYGHNNDRSRIY